MTSRDFNVAIIIVILISVTDFSWSHLPLKAKVRMLDNIYYNQIILLRLVTY